MKKYIIELTCCEGSTLFDMELDDSQKELVELMAAKSVVNSTEGGQPTMRIGEKWSDMKCPDCDTDMGQDIDEYTCQECFSGYNKSWLLKLKEKWAKCNEGVLLEEFLKREIWSYSSYSQIALNQIKDMIGNEKQ